MDGLHFQSRCRASTAARDGRGHRRRRSAQLAAEAAEHWTGPRARADPAAAARARARASCRRRRRARASPIGVEERGAGPRLGATSPAPDPHFLVFGDSQSGKSSLLRGLGARAGRRRTRPEELQLVVVDVRRSLIDLAHDPHVLAYAAYAARRPARPPSACARSRASGWRRPTRRRSPAPSWAGPRHVVLFDDYDLVAGPTGGPLAPLLDVLAVGRRRRPARRARAPRRRQRARRLRGRLRPPARARLARRAAQRRPGRGAAAGRRQGRSRSRPAAGCSSAAASARCSIQTAFSPPTPVPGAGLRMDPTRETMQ